MSIVFLIGNGFDLACGLQTRYSDMYKEYCKIKDIDSIIIKEFKQDISKNEYTTWANFELGMARYLTCLSCETDFINCLNDFKKFLIKYLKNQQKIFFDKIKDNLPLNIALQNEAKRSLNEFYKGISNNLDRQIQEIKNKESKIICFNYTNILRFLTKPAITTDDLYDYDFIQIHGTLNDETVMGIDNKFQLKPNFPITQKLIRSFVKPEFNDEFDSLRNSRAENFIRTANVICVYGLSLGESDLKWRNLIKKRIAEDTDVHLFIFSYDLIQQNDLLNSEKLSLEDDKRKEIIKLWEIDNPENVSRRIHFPCGNQIFCFDEIFKLNDEYNVKGF